MTKFLNKKEQVYDLKLTSYGKYLLSIGRFKPVYYAFFDDNVLYDKTYTTGTPAVATYTQVSVPNASIVDQIVILEDASATTRNFTFKKQETDTSTISVLISGSTSFAAAEGTIVLTDPGAGTKPVQFNGKTIVLTDVAGNAVTFKGLTGYDAGDPQKVHSTLYIYGVADIEDIGGNTDIERNAAYAIDQAFDLAYANGDLQITSDRSSATITLTQVYGGDMGDTTITATDLVTAGNMTVTNFTGGSTKGAPELTTEVVKAINLANKSGLIGISATTFAVSASFVMDTIGTDGNGKTITGTAISNAHATVTPFAGGSNLQYEAQNDVYARIKDETQYLESFVLFRDLDDSMSELKGGYEDYAEGDEITPIMSQPDADIFRFNRMIGDAWLDGDTNKAPAWKIVSLQSKISSSAQYETGSYTQIPQVNYNLTYTLSTQTSEFVPSPNEIDELEETTLTFVDGDVIALESDNPLIYVEEANTELLVENFDIEVFMVTGSENRTLERKYFENEIPQVVNGMLISETPQENLADTFTTNSVEYYFDILTDTQINSLVACRGAEIFNKKSYYVDLDFDCDETQQEDIFFDIYGSVTEPEICLD